MSGKGLTKSRRILPEGIFIFYWLMNLAPLYGTDTYYSPFLLCALVGMVCLVSNAKAPPEPRGRNRCALCLASALFSAAVCLANRQVFDAGTVQNCLDIACGFMGGFFAAYHILLFLLHHELPARAEAGPLPPWGVWALVFASVAGIDLMYLFFCRYPGVLTTDSVSALEQFLGEGGYDNVSPFYHTVTVQLFYSLGYALFGSSNAAVATFHCAQILFLAACFGYAVMTLYQAGAPRWATIAACALYALVPYNIAYSVTMWKDIPFAGAALLLAAALWRLLRGIGRKPGNYAAFLAGAAGFCLWRTNGYYAFAAGAAVLLLLCRNRRRELGILAAVVLALGWILLHPVLSALGVRGSEYAEIFAVPFQQVARLYANGREIDPEDEALLAQAFQTDKLAEAYDPQTVDPVKYDTFRYDREDSIREHWREYLGLYFRLWRQYPGDFLEAWVEETKGFWSGGCNFWIYTKGVAANDFGVTESYGTGPVARLFAAVFRYWEKLELLQPLQSIGLYAWMLVGGFLIALLKGRRGEAALAAPCLVLLVGLWLGTPVYAEFRYAYPMILTVPLFLPAVFLGKSK